MRLEQLQREMARPLGRRGDQRRKELVPSITMGGLLNVESALEASTAVGLDIDPRIGAYWAQPFAIRLDLLQVFPTQKEALAAHPRPPRAAAGEQSQDAYVYTPDFEIRVDGKPLVIECKLSGEIERIPEQVARWRSALSALGYPFACVTELDVGCTGLDFNMVCIRDATKALRTRGAASLQPLLQELDQRQGLLTVGALRSKVPDYLIQMGIAGGALGCDLKAGVLGPDTDLWRAGGDLSHLQVLKLDL